MMSPQEQADRSRRLLNSIEADNPGDIITILALALQMAICLGARTRQDAIDMIDAIMTDADRDMGDQYDKVAAMIKREAN